MSSVIYQKPKVFKEEFGCSMKAVSSENKIIQNIEEYDNFLILEKESFGDWNNMIKSLRKYYRESVTLKKV